MSDENPQFAEKTKQMHIKKSKLKKEQKNREEEVIIG